MCFPDHESFSDESLPIPSRGGLAAVQSSSLLWYGADGRRSVTAGVRKRRSTPAPDAARLGP